jgi:hypothetical protein
MNFFIFLLNYILFLTFTIIKVTFVSKIIKNITSSYHKYQGVCNEIIHNSMCYGAYHY